MGAIGGGVAWSVKGDWVIHKVLNTSSIAFHSSSGTTAVLLLLYGCMSKTLLAWVANVPCN